MFRKKRHCNNEGGGERHHLTQGFFISATPWTFFSAQSLSELLLMQFAQSSWENTSFPMCHSISGIVFHHVRKSFSYSHLFSAISYSSGLVEITLSLIVRGYAGCSGTISRVLLQSLEEERSDCLLKAKT